MGHNLRQLRSIASHVERVYPVIFKLDVLDRRTLLRVATLEHGKHSKQPLEIGNILRTEGLGSSRSQVMNVQKVVMNVPHPQAVVLECNFRGQIKVLLSLQSTIEGSAQGLFRQARRATGECEDRPQERGILGDKVSRRMQQHPLGDRRNREELHSKKENSLQGFAVQQRLRRTERHVVGGKFETQQRLVLFARDNKGSNVKLPQPKPHLFPHLQVPRKHDIKPRPRRFRRNWGRSGHLKRRHIKGSWQFTRSRNGRRRTAGSKRALLFLDRDRDGLLLWWRSGRCWRCLSSGTGTGEATGRKSHVHVHVSGSKRLAIVDIALFFIIVTAVRHGGKDVLQGTGTVLELPKHGFNVCGSKRRDIQHVLVVVFFILVVFLGLVLLVVFVVSVQVAFVRDEFLVLFVSSSIIGIRNERVVVRLVVRRLDF